LKIKSTGFAFLGPFLGAFVEPDEKKMAKKSKADQMGILSAGVFSNLIFAGIFLLILAGVFYLNFVPSGALFDTYSSSIVNVSSINKIDGIFIENNSNQGLINMIENKNISSEVKIDLNGENKNLTRIYAGNKSYLVSLENLKEQLETGTNFLRFYGDYPAINAGLRGAIIEIQGKKIKTYSDLSEVMEKYSAGEKINIKTTDGEEIIEYDITLAEHPNEENKGIIGVGNTIMSTAQIEYTFAFFREPFTNYQAKSEFVSFIYYLVFWIFLLNLLVAFFNMLPFAILDGGRFFYLTVLGITKNEKISEKIYKSVGMLILFFLLLMMVVWFFRII
jgi:membrane-associated protease RseP (regulator of RpoE activity)